MLKAVKPTKVPGSKPWLDDCIIRGRSEVFTEIVDVTPFLAGLLLQANPANRSINETTVVRYATDMLNARWVMNGEAIKVSRDGMLNDGQHRLSAVIAANRCVPMLVTFGLDRESRMTLDQGQKRTAGNYLDMAGVANANIAAVIARLLLAYERSGSIQSNFLKILTNAEIIERVQSDDAVIVSARFATHRNNVGITPGAFGFCHYTFSRVSPAEAEKFLAEVANGEGLRKRDPAMAVRDWHLARITKGERIQREPSVEVIFKAWNKYRQGKGSEKFILQGILPAVI